MFELSLQLTVRRRFSGVFASGHLGTPNPQRWPDRRGLSEKVTEFEAKSVSYLVYGRAGIDTPSEEYLTGYLKDQPLSPPVSLDCAVKAAGLTENMGLGALRPREKSKQA